MPVRPGRKRSDEPCKLSIACRANDFVFEEGSLFNMLSEPAKKELENIGRISKQTIEVRNIHIPRLMLTPHYGELVITDFDLDTQKLSRYATDASILEQIALQRGEPQRDIAQRLRIARPVPSKALVNLIAKTDPTHLRCLLLSDIDIRQLKP